MDNRDINIKGEKVPAHAETNSGKLDMEMIENSTVTLTEEDNARIRKKTDKTILVILTWVYFLQVLDKAVLGTGAVFSLQADAKLTGHQYSLIGSVASMAQLAWQPFSAWLIVKVPHRYLMPALILGWGTAETCLAACNSFGSLMACRFFLGLFEAGCLPLFSIITSHWYRRVEQPIRVSIWYSTNGLATIVASAISYGLGHIESDILHPWQIIFLFCGLLTVVTAPFVYWKLDSDVTTARFLTPHERLQGVERLKANNTGVVAHEFKWEQVWEAALEPKTWLWLVLAILPNLGSTLPSIFGPLIINGFGFSKYQTLLLNMPFGAMQMITIVASCFAANKLKLKGVTLVGFMLPVVVGTAMLYGLKRGVSERPALLVAYYICSFLYSANPLLLSWVVGNTAGATKKAVTLSLYQAGLSAGGLIGPLLFDANQAPVYRKGIAGVLGVFIAMICLVLLQLFNLVILNKKQAKRRVANGKSAVIVDQSMQREVNTDSKTGDPIMDEPQLDDVTDRKNDEFVYVY